MSFYHLRRLQVLVMHSDPIISAGLVSSLREQPGLNVIVHAGFEVGSAVPKIDVLLADYRNALCIIEERNRMAPENRRELRVLVITGNEREADIRRAFEAGVRGYLVLGSPLEELIAAVTSVARGLLYRSVSVAQRIADSLSHASLTSRESEVLSLVANGCPNKAIARELGIELGTVKSHVSAIMTKLGADSRTQAARIAASRGLVPSASEGATDPRFSRGSPVSALQTA